MSPPEQLCIKMGITVNFFNVTLTVRGKDTVSINHFSKERSAEADLLLLITFYIALFSALEQTHCTCVT